MQTDGSADTVRAALGTRICFYIELRYVGFSRCGLWRGEFRETIGPRLVHVAYAPGGRCTPVVYEDHMIVMCSYDLCYFGVLGSCTQN